MTAKDKDTKDTKDTYNARKDEGDLDEGTLAARKANEGFGEADPDDPSLNTYDIDAQGADRRYPARKPRPAETEPGTLATKDADNS